MIATRDRRSAEALRQLMVLGFVVVGERLSESF